VPKCALAACDVAHGFELLAQFTPTSSTPRARKMKHEQYLATWVRDVASLTNPLPHAVLMALSRAARLGWERERRLEELNAQAYWIVLDEGSPVLEVVEGVPDLPSELGLRASRGVCSMWMLRTRFEHRWSDLGVGTRSPPRCFRKARGETCTLVGSQTGWSCHRGKRPSCAVDWSGRAAMHAAWARTKASPWSSFARRACSRGSRARRARGARSSSRATAPRSPSGARCALALGAALVSLGRAAPATDTERPR